MAFDFPATPSEGQIFSPAGGPSYVFNSPVWKAIGQGQIAVIADTAPANPANGALWYESDTGILYIWYVDPNSAQWVQVGGVTTGGAYVLKAGDTMTGALTVNSSINATGNITAGVDLYTGTWVRSTSTVAGVATNSAGTVYLRPNGAGSTTGQMTLDNAGTVNTAGGVISASGIQGTNIIVPVFSSTGATDGKQIFNTVIQSSRIGTAAANHLQFFNTNGAVGQITTTASATAYGTSSDELLKDFIGPYDPLKAIDIIRRDPVRDFTWKTDGSYAIGWGAQTSYAISEDLASPPEPPEEGKTAIAVGEAGYQPWGMDQGRRTPYLWAALAWALDEIDDLKARVVALEAR